MQQPPARPVTRRAAVLVARVQADLHGGGVAHHDPPPGPAPVEELLHGRVTRQVEDAAGRADGIDAVAGQRQARGANHVAQRGQVVGGRGGGAQGVNPPAAAGAAGGWWFPSLIRARLLRSGRRELVALPTLPYGAGPSASRG